MPWTTVLQRLEAERQAAAVNGLPSPHGLLSFPALPSFPNALDPGSLPTPTMPPPQESVKLPPLHVDANSVPVSHIALFKDAAQGIRYQNDNVDNDLLTTRALFELDDYFADKSVMSSNAAAMILCHCATEILQLRQECTRSDDQLQPSCRHRADYTALDFLDKIRNYLSATILSAAEQGTGTEAWSRTKNLVQELRRLPKHTVHIHNVV